MDWARSTIGTFFVVDVQYRTLADRLKENLPSENAELHDYAKMLIQTNSPNSC